MPATLEAIGTVEAYSTDPIRAQVNGQLLDVNVRDGDFVTKGQLLFTIDPRPHEAVLAQARAALARDQAVAANKDAQQEEAYKIDQGAIPRKQMNSLISAADSSGALVSADQSAVETAALDLSHCKIYAPLSGRASALMVKPGSLVKAGDAPMAVISQIQPVYVTFAVPQESLGDVTRFLSQATPVVQATLPDDHGAAERGTLTFVDNTVDEATGAIQLQATFANEKNRLWPGLHVNTVLRLSEDANVAVAPSRAIPSGQPGASPERKP